MAITKTQKKELEKIQSVIWETRYNLDDFKFKYREKLDYMKEELIQDCMDELEQIENKIDKEFQLLKEEA